MLGVWAASSLTLTDQGAAGVMDRFKFETTRETANSASYRHRPRRRQASIRQVPRRQALQRQPDPFRGDTDRLAHPSGTVDPGRIYESPFTSVAPEGPEAILPDDVNEFFQIVKHFHNTAVT